MNQRDYNQDQLTPREIETIRAAVNRATTRLPIRRMKLKFHQNEVKKLQKDRTKLNKSFDKKESSLNKNIAKIRDEIANDEFLTSFATNIEKFEFLQSKRKEK